MYSPVATILSRGVITVQRTDTCTRALLYKSRASHRLQATSGGTDHSILLRLQEKNAFVFADGK